MLKVSHNSHDELKFSSTSAIDIFQVSKIGDVVVLGVNK
jgi:hypothetical protein